MNNVEKIGDWYVYFGVWIFEVGKIVNEVSVLFCIGLLLIYIYLLIMMFGMIVVILIIVIFWRWVKYEWEILFILIFLIILMVILGFCIWNEVD